MDVSWWTQFIGTAPIHLEKQEADAFIATDATLKGIGGFAASLGEFFRAIILRQVQQPLTHISTLAIIVALKVWYQHLCGKLIVLCDNEAVCQVINVGAMDRGLSSGSSL